MPIHTIFSIAVAICLSLVNAQDPICYNINNVQQTGLFSCDPTAEASACCSPGDICYSDGRCAPSQEAIEAGAATITAFFWDACTDPTFQDPACFQACHDIPGNGIQACTAQGIGKYCCYGFEGCDCTNSTQVFSLEAAQIITTLSLSMTHTPSTSSKISTKSKTSASSSPTSDTSNPTNTLTSASSSPANPTAQSITNTQSTGTSTSRSVSTSTAPPKAKDSSSNNGTAIGVGVGVGVPAVIAIVGILYFFRRRWLKKQNSLVELPTHDTDDMRGVYRSPVMQMTHEAPEMRSTEYQHKYYSELDTGRPAVEMA